MNEHPKDLGTDNAGKTTDSASGNQASDKLRSEYFSGAKSIGPELTPNEQRMLQERVDFGDKYDKQNFDLGQLKNGWGPFQALKQYVKDHNISLPDEEIVKEARRIRDRDFSKSGRDYYNTTDNTKFWSQDEIDRRVETNVERIKGIDVSHGNKDINWSKVKDAGYKFAFLKASEGITIKDERLDEYRKGATDVGMRIGYYHYFRPNDSVAEQVKNFVDAVGKPDKGALRLVVDTEDPKIWKPYTVAQRVKMIDEWCKEVQKELGVKPAVTIYGSPSFFNETLKNPDVLGKYDLWIADYNRGEPPVPKPWSNWTFFQYNEHGKVPGIATEVDLDMYAGNDINQAMGAPRKKR